MNDEIEVLKCIEACILGKLSTQEVDELWIKFLKNPEYYDWMIVGLILRSKHLKVNLA